MKQLKKVGLLFVIIFTVCTADLKAQSDNDVVIIRLSEVYGNTFLKPQMIVIAPSGETSVTELEKYKLRNYIETAGKNGIVMQKEIQKWVSKGYRVSSSSIDSQESISNTLIIMIKEE